MFVALDKLTEIPAKAGKLSRSKSVDFDKDYFSESEFQIELTAAKFQHCSLPENAVPQVKTRKKFLNFKPKRNSLPCLYEIGSKVYFYDKNNRRKSGTLRWVGKHDGLNDGLEMLGVEAVSDINRKCQMCCMFYY